MTDLLNGEDGQNSELTSVKNKRIEHVSPSSDGAHQRRMVNLSQPSANKISHILNLSHDIYVPVETGCWQG